MRCLAPRRVFIHEPKVVDGVRYRSKMEARYAQYLAFLVKVGEVAEWSYEPKVFWFTPDAEGPRARKLAGIRRGVTSYRPDFLVKFARRPRHEWHEVKGYLDARSRVALDRMRLYYPEETVVVIDAPYMAQLKRTVGGILHW